MRPVRAAAMGLGTVSGVRSLECPVKSFRKELEFFMALRRNGLSDNAGVGGSVRSTLPRAAVAVLGVSALLIGVAACSSEDSDKGTATGVTPTSPLLDAVLLGGQEYAEFEDAQLSKYHASLKSCLEAAGFEYTVPPAYQVNVQADRAESLELAQSVGYGIVAESDGVTFAEDDSASRLFIYPITPEQSDQRDKEFQEAETKNEDYLESLSDERADEYQVVRTGELTDDSFEVDEDGNLVPSEDGTESVDSSCETTASEALSDPGVDVFESEEFAETYDLIMAFYESVDADESISKIYAEWSQCLADSTGETFASPYDLSTELSNELEAAYGATEMLDTDEESALDDSEIFLDDEAEQDSDIVIEEQSHKLPATTDTTAELESGDEEITEEDLALLEDELAFEDEESYDDYTVDEAALTALEAREIKWATADVTCRFDQDFFNKIQNAQIALEEKFVEENKAVFEDLATAIREARAAA